MSFSLPSHATSPDASIIGPVLVQLRAEYEASDSDARRGQLLHEIGILEDLAKNDGQAARDLLAAVNAAPDSHEPLERLVILIERRKSYKNLGKLLDRLAKVAETPEETARALVGLAAFREDQEGDTAGAREALERATQVKGDDAEAWLALERLAARLGDRELRRRCLAARADLATEPTWKALLLVDLAVLLRGEGQTDPALEALEKALALASSATFAALSELERLGRTENRPALVARALEEQARLIDLATQGSTEPPAAGVPEEVRTRAHAADALLRAANLHLGLGDTERGTALLERVAEVLPDDPATSAARLAAAELSGDVAAQASIAKKELERGVHGPAAAALWMRVAEAAATGGDAATALSALKSALQEDPACIPARALELHLLGGGDPAALAQALEAAATQLGSEELAAEFFLLAADTWARGASDGSAAKAALSQAAASHAPLDLVARTGRMLAAITADTSWFDEATRRLITAGAPEDELASLWFELGRGRLLRGERPGAAEAFSALARVPGGAWLGNVLHAYAIGASRTEGETARTGDAEALEALSSLATDGDLATAYRIAAALRFQLRGALEAATRDLSELHAKDPGDLVVAAALASALRRSGNVEGAADALATCALHAKDADLGAALTLEAGIVKWLAGNREAAIALFESAAEIAPEAASGLLAWALRAARPNDVAARRKALDAAEASEDAALVALERFGLEAGEGGNPEAARRSLSGVAGSGALAVALDLGAALAGDLAASTRALESLREKGPEAAALVASAEHFASSLGGNGEPGALAASAEAWATADPTNAAALEWLVQAVAASDVDGEIRARELLGTRIGGGAGAALTASARLMRRVARDDSDVELVASTGPDGALVNLELSPPSCEPRRRAAALLASASLFDPASATCALALAGWNFLALEDAASAVKAFRGYLEAFPEDIVGWEGVRAAAELSNDKALLAEASAALGDLTSDAGQGAELWERAATILLDDLGDAGRGELALSRAIDRDITRHGAFDRLFRMVRARKDGPRLLELVAARLAVAEDPTEIAKLYWERARVLREAGDSTGALEALGNVTMLEPDHVGALALTGEIHITEKRYAEAAESLARLSALSEAPTQQRLMSGIAATDLYENRLGQLGRGLEVLKGLHRAGLSTLPVRERLARAAARAEDWETATEVLEELMAKREARDARIEAARLCMAIYRDRMGAPAQAERAVVKLLEESPTDGEAIDLVLGGALPRPVSSALLKKARDALREALVASPLDLDQMTRLAELARQLDDVQLRQVALGAVVALGGKSPERIEELSRLDSRVARMPQIAVDDSVVKSLRDREDHGPITELLALLATTFAEALGPGLAALGVGKKERVRPQDGLPVRNEVAAWAGALGLGEFEFYVGGREPEGINAVATEVPAIVMGAEVRSPLSALHRQALARELLALKLGMTILRHRDATDVAALTVAACSIGGARLESPPYAMLAEFERQLSKEMPRRVRKLLPDLASSVARSGADPLAWVRAAQSTLDRMAAVAVGDVSWVLTSGEGSGRGSAPITSESKLRAARLLSFVLSPAFFAIREKLGMGIR